MTKTNLSSCTFRVAGTHCRSCELLIEKEISAIPGINSVSASSSTGLVKVSYQSGRKPALQMLNKLFADSGYTFTPGSDTPIQPLPTNWLAVIGISTTIILAFFFIQRLDFFSSFQVSQSTLTPSFFIFGLLAGFSTCAALVGGLILSLSHQWNNLYSVSDSSFHKLQPVFMFNLGRLISFSIFGALLGYFGSFIRLSLTSGAIVTVLVSVLMIILGLQMLGLKALSSFQLALPKAVTGRLANETNFRGRLMPLLMGGLTFFLPCGFTLTSQSLALASGDPLHGLLIMFFFSLGTFVPLTLIGYSGVKNLSNKNTSRYFSQIAGILVICFSLFNIHSQFNVLNLRKSPSLGPLSSSLSSSQSLESPFINGKYVLKMDASSTSYTPNNFTVKAGQPVRWEITDRGTSGCTNVIISRSLFNGQINLTPGVTSVKEFVAPTVPGVYHFSCWMGMVSGTIEVI